MVTEEEVKKFYKLVNDTYPNAQFDIVATPNAVSIQFTIIMGINLDVSIPLDDEARILSIGPTFTEAVEKVIHSVFPPRVVN